MVTCSKNITLIEVITGIVDVDDDPMVRLEARQGGHTPTNVDPRLYHDIQVQLNRLVNKASRQQIC